MLLLLALTCGLAQLSAATGADLFADNCAACHGADGKARTPMGKKLGAKDLRASQMTQAQVAERIAQGFSDASGKPRMPAFKDQLTADEIRQIAAFVVSFRDAAQK